MSVQQGLLLILQVKIGRVMVLIVTAASRCFVLYHTAQAFLMPFDYFLMTIGSAPISMRKAFLATNATSHTANCKYL